MSTKAALAAFEEELRFRYAPRSLGTYLSHLKAFCRWLEAQGVGPCEVRSADLLTYQSALLAARRRDGRPYSPGFHKQRICFLKTLYRFLYRRGFLLQDPSSSLELPRAESRLPVVLTRSEARRILEAPRGRSPHVLRDRAILETLYGTGIRYSELAGLTPYDVDTEDGVVRVVQGKGGKDRTVPLTSAAARAIETYLSRGRAALLGARRSRLLFFGSKHGRRLHGDVVNELVRRWARKAGVKKHVTCHCFRHCAGSRIMPGSGFRARPA